MGLFLEPAAQGRKIPIDKAVVFFGRHPDCDVVLTRSRKVSRKHCCIAQVDDRLVIRDLGSMNGVKVNGERIKKEKDLSLGDEVTIGDVVYKLKNENNQEKSPEKKTPKKKPAASQKAERKPASKPVKKKKKPPEKDFGLSMDFPVPIDEDDEDFEIIDDDMVEDTEEESENTPSSLPLASLNQIEDDEEYDELGEDDIVDEDDEEFFEFDYDVDEDDSDDDIILLDD